MLLFSADDARASAGMRAVLLRGGRRRRGAPGDEGGPLRLAGDLFREAWPLPSLLPGGGGGVSPSVLGVRGRRRRRVVGLPAAVSSWGGRRRRRLRGRPTTPGLLLLLREGRVRRLGRRRRGLVVSRRRGALLRRRRRLVSGGGVEGLLFFCCRPPGKVVGGATGVVSLVLEFVEVEVEMARARGFEDLDPEEEVVAAVDGPGGGVSVGEAAIRLELAEGEGPPRELPDLA
mmetsp:Transcript_28098/g.90575  ORF Transcript_28098/g.90575 Transcript_28098/m.90575 type:complete len:231 (+) Transcript_28098:635-1327(+)